MTPDQTEYTVLPSCLASDRRLDDLDREEGLESACEKANAHVGLPKLKLAYRLGLSEKKKSLKLTAARAARVPLPPPRSPEEPGGPLQEEEEGGGDDAGGEKLGTFYCVFPFFLSCLGCNIILFDACFEAGDVQSNISILQPLFQ